VTIEHVISDLYHPDCLCIQSEQHHSSLQGLLATKNHSKFLCVWHLRRCHLLYGGFAHCRYHRGGVWTLEVQVAFCSSQGPQTLSDSLRKCCPQSLPNIFVPLKLFATLSSFELLFMWEISICSQTIDYLRCMQTEERLSALVLIHSNYENIRLQWILTGSANCF
jgi:hypothetical protein